MEKEQRYIGLCKELIEKRLQWQPSHSWKQRDYLNLIQVLEDKTGILLSLSTIKRIWKPDFEGTPQPATLEAFAKFLDYRDWLDFKAQHPIPTAQSSVAIAPQTPHQRFSPKKKWLIAALLLVGFMAVLGFIRSQKQEAGVSSGVFYEPSQVSFSCENAVGMGVPNTVIFDYDLSKVRADSFFIQQSWNKFRREKIEQKGTKLTSTYFYPGYHQAKLVANDSILKETKVLIKTEGWLALVRDGFQDENPTYIRENIAVGDGLKVSQQQFSNSKAAITNKSILSFFNIGGYEGIHTGRFSLEAKLKCDSVQNINCPIISLILQGEGEMYYLPLVAKGCVGNIGVKLGDVVKSGKTNDLSAFGTDVYAWQILRLEVANKLAKVFLNGKNIMSLPFEHDIGRLQGVNVNFAGSGRVEYLRVAGL